MKITWVFMLALGVVAADVSLGYHYKVPQTSYGVPSYQLGGNSGQYSTAYSGSQGYQGLAQSLGSGYQSAGSGYQSTGSEYQGAGYQGLGNGYYQTSGASQSGSIVQPIYQQTASSGLGSGYQTQYASSSQYQSSAVKKYQQYYQVHQQPTQVFKHFYIHAAPEEPEQVKPRAPIVLPPAQKHYKIIFVKAPSESSAPNVIAPIQPQNEEKTIVYVLVKKPEDQQDVVLPKIEQKPPSKPEVYFIKYKNKEDSQAVINNIVQDYNKGQSVSLVSPSLGDSSYQTSLSNVQYQAPAQQGFSSGSFGSQGLSSGSFGTQGLSSGSFDSQQGLSSGGYGSQQAVSSASYSSLGSQGYGTSSGDLSDVVISSSIAPPVSSTASTHSYDGSAISTSQGVPHETYGPPSFRNN